MELLTIGQVSRRAGVAPSALRYYEEQGLVTAARTAGGARRYQRSVLRRLAFVRAAQNVGTVRRDVDVPDVKALMVGAQAMQTYKPEIAARLTEVVLDGLRAG